MELDRIVESLCRDLSDRDAPKVISVFHKPSEDIILDFWKINLCIQQDWIKLFNLSTYNSTNSFINLIHNKLLKLSVHLGNKSNDNSLVPWFFTSSWWDSWELINNWFCNYSSSLNILGLYAWKTPLSLAKWFGDKSFLVVFCIFIFVAASWSYFIADHSKVLIFTFKTPATYFS